MYNVSYEDKRLALESAACSYSGARKRWEERRQTGLSDDDLKKALEKEFGIYGGGTHRNTMSIAYQGAGLKVWFSPNSSLNCSDQLILQGVQTVRMARAVFRVPNPDDDQLGLF